MTHADIKWSRVRDHLTFFLVVDAAGGLATDLSAITRSSAVLPLQGAKIGDVIGTVREYVIDLPPVL